MSDVERICEANYQRVRWAQELERVPADTSSDHAGSLKEDGRAHRPAPTGRGGRKALPSAKMQKKRRMLRTASLFCAMLCGVSVTCTLWAIEAMNVQTLVPGVIGAVVFLTSGWLMDEKVEEMTA